MPNLTNFAQFILFFNNVNQEISSSTKSSFYVWFSCKQTRFQKSNYTQFHLPKNHCDFDYFWLILLKMTLLNFWMFRFLF